MNTSALYVWKTLKPMGCFAPLAGWKGICTLWSLTKRGYHSPGWIEIPNRNHPVKGGNETSPKQMKVYSWEMLGISSNELGDFHGLSSSCHLRPCHWIAARFPTRSLLKSWWPGAPRMGILVVQQVMTLTEIVQGMRIRVEWHLITPRPKKDHLY